MSRISHQRTRPHHPLLHGFFVSVFTLCLLGGISPQTAAGTAFEGPVIVSAKNILSPEQLKGPNHSVEDRVLNNGLFYQYTVTSPYGTFKANATSALDILIQEMNAIAAMKKVATGNTAVNAVEQSGKNTISGMKNLVTDPLGTVEGAAEGVGNLFSRAKQTIGRRETTDTEDSKIAQMIGFSEAKGRIATKFGVSVYSGNKVLQEELERLARADYLGGLTIGVATSAVPGVGGIVLTTSGTARLLNEVVNNTPASKLWVQNKNTLAAMGIDPDTIEFFLNNPVFSPALATGLVSALASMDGVVNRDIFVKIGLQASTPDMARTITELAMLTAGYHKNIAPLQKLVPMARVCHGVNKKGDTIVILPTDNLLWNERNADLSEYLTANSKGKNGGIELWTWGSLSKRMQSELQARGWKVHEKAASTLRVRQS